MNTEEDEENIEKMIKTFEDIINNPLSQKMLNNALVYCNKCGKTRLESALDYYLGKQDNICLKCKVTYELVEIVIHKALKSFNTSKESLIKTMQDEYWEKGLISTFKGMATFGVKKPFTPGAPFQIVWNITQACNFNCIHCYENAGKKGPDELNKEEILNGIDKLADLGIASLAFSGGEPSIHPQIKEFIKHANDRGLYVSMATNGYIFNDYEKAKELKDLGLQFVQISLDGVNPKTHDNFRQKDGSWKRAIEAIKNFKKAGVFVEISTTATKKNKDEIPEMITFLRSINVDWFVLYNFIPTGKGAEISEIDLSPEERLNLLELIYKENSKGEMQILSTAPQFADVVTHTFNNDQMIPTHFYNVEYSNPAMMKLSEFVGGCGAGRFYMSIEPNGDIYPCVFFPHEKEVKLGNIRDDVENIWTNNPLLMKLRDKDALLGHCGVCDSRYICGGCRARAYNYFHDVTYPDPGCEKNKNAWDKIIEKESSEYLAK
ncbi:radical SAM protein [Methanobrevibacter acididurans]|uniref:radical SAM protein n=1 Tax=Methanobrevibacter acididurans TaxID=120963 RepID=UPI0038FC4DBD